MTITSSKPPATNIPMMGKTPPGPGGNLMQSMLEIRKKGMIEYFMDSWKRYGDIVRFQMGPVTNILLVKPDNIHHVLVKNASNYTKGISMDKLKLSLGEGLFASEGVLWRQQRQLMQPMFTPRAIGSFGGAMIEDIQNLLDRWQTYEKDQQFFDVNQEMMRLAMGIIARTMFSMSIDQTSMEAARAFAYVLEFVSQQTIRFVDLPMWFPTSSNQKFKASMRILDAFIYGVIAKRRLEYANDPVSLEDQKSPVGKYNDLLDLLLQARNPETGEYMSDKQIRDEVITIFFAGHETTAQALTWTYFLLAQHPEEEAKMQAELDKDLGGRTPSLTDLESLAHTRRIIDESMRLFPPILMFARQPIAPDLIDGYSIPAGAMITVSQYLTHRHPEYWENPEQFNPDNFLPEKMETRPRYAYFPFGGGQRICIGNNFALLEMALALSMIGQVYKLRLVPGQDIHPRMVGTLRPNGPVMMTLERR